MDLKIDPEFSQLLPPLMQGEYEGLESSIVNNGYNPAFPVIVWKGQDIIVDGHNRYLLCQKHGVSFKTIEQEFASRYEVITYILKTQLDRRNINNSIRTYLIGRMYLAEKKEHGGDRKSSGQNDHLGKTAGKIAKQLNIGEKTVRRAAEYTQAVDTIVSNTGIKATDILSGRMKGFQDDIKALSELDADSQKRIAYFILEEGEADLESATNRLKREKQDRLLKEAEEKRQQMEAQLKAKREEEAAQEKAEQEKQNKKSRTRKAEKSSNGHHEWYCRDKTQPN